MKFKAKGGRLLCPMHRLASAQAERVEGGGRAKRSGGEEQGQKVQRW